MSTRRAMAAATALLVLAALAAAGCGLGPGEDLGEAGLTVTRDYGSEPVVDPTADEVTESDTVMRVLERSADIETRFGGGFVQSIEGLEAEEGISGDPRDWFFYVNGVESTVGAADYPLDGGEQIWWDYRDWGAAMGVSAVVGSWPQPFAGGYDGRDRPVAVECEGPGGAAACEGVRTSLDEAGVTVASASQPGAIRILVGDWERLRADPAAGQIEDGPEASGVFAEVGASRRGCRIEGLDEDGAPAAQFGPDAGLVAATRRYEAPPVWVVTGCTAAGVEAAAGLLDAEHLRGRYAVVADGGTSVALPLPSG